MLSPPFELKTFCESWVPVALMTTMPGPALSRTRLRLNTTLLPAYA